MESNRPTVRTLTKYKPQEVRPYDHSDIDGKSIHRSSSPVDSHSIAGPIPDDDYFHVENVYIQVSNRLFAVPKEHLDFPESSFHVMFRDGSLNKDAIRGLIPRGSHSTHPIVLTGIDVEAFRCFLAVAWPRSNTYTQLDVQGWKHVLVLATGWKYDKIRDRARTQVYNSLQNKDPFELLKLGRQFHYREWVVHGYSLLARPGFMLSGNLLLANGLGDKMSDIFMIREAMRQAESRRPLTCMGCNTPPPPDPTAMGPGASSRHPATGILMSQEEAAGIAYCKCRQVIFLRMTTGSFDWVSMSKRLVEWVFADELAELNSNKKLVPI